MPSGMKLKNSKELIKTLTFIGIVAREKGNSKIRELAEEIKEGAKQRAPELTGDLVESIKIDHSSLSSTKFKSAVYVDTAIIPYAIKMHEGVPLGNKYNLGKISRSKNAGRPEHWGTGVGYKFLERAFNSVYRKALKEVKETIFSEMKKKSRRVK